MVHKNNITVWNVTKLPSKPSYEITIPLNDKDMIVQDQLTIEFSPDNKKLAVIQMQSTDLPITATVVRIFDLETNTRSKEKFAYGANNKTRVIFPSDSTDGIGLIFRATEKKDASLKKEIFKVNVSHSITQKIVWEIEGKCLGLSPDGSLVMIRHQDKSIKIYKTSTGAPVYTLQITINDKSRGIFLGFFSDNNSRCGLSNLMELEIFNL